MGSTHALFAATAWLALADRLAPSSGAPVVIAGTVVAAATGAGRWTSPDVDRTRWLCRIVGGHRGVTHWPETAAVLSWACLTLLPGELAWPLVVGWWSHLVGDLLFGGIPFLVLGGRRRVGLRLDTDGLLESGKARLLGRERRLLPTAPLRTALAVTTVFLAGVTAGWWTAAAPADVWAALRG
jgi:hypothetical protein